jgi:hypothetical protein
MLTDKNFTDTLVNCMHIANKFIPRLYPLYAIRSTKNLKLHYIMQYIAFPILTYLTFLCIIRLTMHFVQPTDYLKMQFILDIWILLKQYAN